MLIFALGHKKRQGKDVIANYLNSAHGFYKLAFADSLKVICKELYNLNEEELNGSLKEILNLNWGLTPRQLMQLTGDGLRLYMGSNVFIKSIDLKIHQLKSQGIEKFVISDLRFKNEADYIKSINGLTFKITNSRIINIDSHRSENELSNYEWDHFIENNSSFQDLYKKVDEVVYTLGDK